MIHVRCLSRNKEALPVGDHIHNAEQGASVYAVGCIPVSRDIGRSNHAVERDPIICTVPLIDTVVRSVNRNQRTLVGYEIFDLIDIAILGIPHHLGKFGKLGPGKGSPVQFPDTVSGSHIQGTTISAEDVN